LTPGNYTLQVQDYGGDSFHYFDVDGETIYDNPAAINVPEENITITVYYDYLPNYSLTVEGNAWGDPAYANVWIDDEWMGYTDDTFTVKAGYHYIEVDEFLEEGWFFYYWYVSGGGEEYINPIGLTFSSAKTITAEYCLG
jgi:hypothetical protein